MGYMATSAEDSMIQGLNIPIQDKERRGINTYTQGEIVNIGGYDKEGKYIISHTQVPLFELSPQQREDIARLNSYVFGIVFSRMNKISGLKWSVERAINKEDEIIENLRQAKQLLDEYNDQQDLKHLILRQRLKTFIKEELLDIKEDLSNFDQSLIRWRRNNKIQLNQSKSQIEEWIESPNVEDDFQEFKKKWVFDLMVHGASAIYKKYYNERLEDIYLIAGGTMYPLRGKYAGDGTGYAQMIPGFTPKIYFSDEIAFDRYVPTSARSYGLVPLDSLINKIAESMLFDQLAAERADGTKPPEKAVVFGRNNQLVGDLGNIDLDTGMDVEEQKRIETKMNTARKNAIIVLTGVGTPVPLDLSKADTFSEQSARQDKLLRDIALVFNMSNAEINLTGSGDTSGRSTSETQERLEREKGIFPIVSIIDRTLTKQIIPFRWGSGWIFEHNTGLTESEQISIDTKKMQSGTYTINEVREQRGDKPFQDNQFNLPPSTQTQQQGQTETNPMFMRNV